MIYKFNSRLLIQKNAGKGIYSLPVVSASTRAELPFFVPTMDIEVLSQNGATDYIAPIRFDDIVRLQVSIQFSDYEKPVWQDIFGGRVLTPEVTFENGSNTAKFNCVGHSDETRYTLLEPKSGGVAPYPLQPNSYVYNIFTVIMSEYGQRLCYDPGIDTETVPVYQGITDYQVKSYQKYLKDFLQDIEKITGYSWFFKERPRYNKDGTLVTPTILDFLPTAGVVTPTVPSSGTSMENYYGFPCQISISEDNVYGNISAVSIDGITQTSTTGSFLLKPGSSITLTYSTTPIWQWTRITTRYKVREGTPRFISGDFSAPGDTVYTRAVEAGKDAGNTQIFWYNDNQTAIEKYGKRVFSEVDNGFTTALMCSNFAKGIVTRFAYPISAGQVVLQGTPEAQIGDYVETYIPSIDLNGSPISNYFTVNAVQHDISANKFTTTLDLGYTIATPETYLLQFAKQAHLSMRNFIQ